MKQHKFTPAFATGQRVETPFGPGVVSSIEVYPDYADYLVAPAIHGADFCQCGEDDCRGSNWFLVDELEVK